MLLLMLCLVTALPFVTFLRRCAAPTSNKMGHRLICGPTGTGKTVYAIQEMLKVIFDGHWVCFAAPHRKAGLDLISELYKRYGKAILSRLKVIDVEKNDKTIMQRLILSSTNPNVFDRMTENEMYASAFMDTVARRRKDITDLAEKPTFEKYTRLTARLAQSQDQWFPEWWLPYAFIPKHQIHTYLVSHCTDPETKREFEMFKSFPVREQLSILDPVYRLLIGVLGSPPVLKMSTRPETVDWKAHYESGGITIILGSDSMAEATGVVIGTHYQKIVFFAHQGIVRPGYFVCDEAINYKQIGTSESHILSMIRWRGVSVWYIIQSRDYPSPEIGSNVEQNTDHVVFRQGTSEMAMWAANNFLGALNEYKIHHHDTVKRQVHKGFDTVSRKTKGVSKNHEGNETHTENVGESLVPIYGEEIEERPVYQSPADQLVWLAQKIQQLPVGTCWIREHNRAPFEFAVPWIADSWTVPGLKKRKIAECLNLLYQRPEYQVPELKVPEITTPMQKRATKHSGNS